MIAVRAECQCLPTFPGPKGGPQYTSPSPPTARLLVSIPSWSDTITNKDNLSVSGSLVGMSGGVITLNARFASGTKMLASRVYCDPRDNKSGSSNYVRSLVLRIQVGALHTS
jgi:hypothetical protein